VYNKVRLILKKKDIKEAGRSAGPHFFTQKKREKTRAGDLPLLRF
jgi:hypothetical protein